MFHNNLPLILTVWVLLLIPLSKARRRNGTAGVGLVTAYMLNLWMLYWAASVLYVLPWYHGTLKDETVAGTELALIGVVGFAIGSFGLAPTVVGMRMFRRRSGEHRSDSALPKAYLAVGLISYAALSVLLGRVLSLTSILSAGQELVVVGLSLCCWRAWKDGGPARALPWIALSLTLPLVTIVTRGYIGYGAVASLSVLIFVSTFVRRKAKVFAAGILLGYLAMSVYVTYMRDRSEIRRSVWGGQSLSDRMHRVSDSAANFEWFDPFNVEHLERIDGRLNQSYLTGAAVTRLERTHDFAEGETIRDAFLSVIPRALWPDKRISAGSGNLVQRFTGINFSRDTSVGIGQVMEFYVNFGTVGVFLGFMVFGVIVTVLDVLATDRLARGDLRGFVLYYLPGLSFMQVGGQLTEITASAAAAMVVAIAVNSVLDNLQKRQERQAEAMGKAFAPAGQIWVEGE